MRFCDWYIEIVKPRMYAWESDPVSANAALWTLRTVLTNALKLLHPYMPFITEEIFCTLHPEGGDHHALRLAGVHRSVEFPGG